MFLVLTSGTGGNVGTYWVKARDLTMSRTFLPTKDHLLPNVNRSEVENLDLHNLVKTFKGMMMWEMSDTNFFRNTRAYSRGS